MKFELTQEFLDQLVLNLEQGQNESVAEQIRPLHPADIADVMQNVSIEQARKIYELLDEEVAAESIIELEEEFRENLLKLFSPEEIAEQVDNLDSDDAADLLGELPEQQIDEVIAQMEDREHASEVTELLNYDEDTAGGLMQSEFMRANWNWPVDKTVVELRKQAEQVEKVYSIYIVDDDEHLKGILSLKQLLFAQPKTPIRDIYKERDLHVAKTHDSSEDVASLMEKYDLVSLPVVDRQNKLVGRITIDDVVDVIREEAEKDFQMASGITQNVESTASVFRHTRSRLPWIIIGLVGGVASSQIIKGYEGQIDINPSLAFFIPLIVATAGNVGVQSSAIIVQGLATKEFQFNGIFKQVMKESAIGLLVGLICSLIIFGVSYALDGDLNLGLTIGISLFIVVIIAAILGAFIPLFLDRIKIDPALATGPFITTANDIIGLSIYFLVAYFVYL
ncbi:MAG: magnesium transporter [Crocinitomicaceae bacterium]|nr:magnesium transporter [Crocinitomicaceae bacterium]